ncbi:MAG: hypothetical protein HXX20_23370 [Chloroflexi bacterium]|nr:hypothetical protein [Chloroflexota bacterium]
MTAELEELVAKVKNLSPDELLTIQETVTAELRRKIAHSPEPKQADTPQERAAILSRFFRPQPSPEEIENQLARMFTPEDLARLKRVDLTQLPPLPPGAKPLSQLIIEDRC